MREFLKFCIVGFVTFLVDYGLLFLLTDGYSIIYLISSAISFIVAVIVNYILCLIFVFNDARNGYRQIVLFILASLIGLALNQFIMWFMVEVISLYYLIAKIIATIIVMMWNFISKKKAICYMK